MAAAAFSSKPRLDVPADPPRPAALRSRRGPAEPVAAGSHHDHVFEFTAIAKLLEYGNSSRHDQHAVAGVVDDVGEVVGMQAQVQRVQDRADRGNREIRFEMLLMVQSVATRSPGLTPSDAAPPPAAVSIDDLAIRHPTDRAIRPAAHDFSIGKERLDPPHDGGNRERIIHHQSAHDGEDTCAERSGQPQI